jgi:hypothetical protein
MNDSSNGGCAAIGNTPPNNGEKLEKDIILKRKCPKCGEEIAYKNRNYFLRCKRENKTCIKCVNVGRIASEETKKKLSTVGKGKKRSDKYKEFMREKMVGNTFGSKNKGSLRSEETKRKMSGARKGRKYPPDRIPYWLGKTGKNSSSFGNKLSEETKEKIRVKRLERVIKSCRFANFNNLACMFFDNLNKKFNWNGCHALFNREKQICGYSLDYYNEDCKLIIEWDEPHHLGEKAKEKDIKRQTRILNKLGDGWGFMRWNEKESCWRKDLYVPNDMTVNVLLHNVTPATV